MSKSQTAQQATSPFFSRAYGGFTVAQADFALQRIATLSDSPVLDPMGGQAHALGQWANKGARVTIADINPGCLALATLRDPRIVRRSDELMRDLRQLLQSDKKLHKRPTEAFTDSWIAPSTHNALTVWGATLGLSSPANLRAALEGRSLFRRFAVAATVLASRRLASFRRSDNLTWLKPGGLVRPLSVAAAIEAELLHWANWAGQTRAIGGRSTGALSVRWSTAPSPLGKHDFVVTSPPYANRLDYSRLWAPELAMLAAIGMVDVRSIKVRQLGSNIMRGLSEPVPLPRTIESVLREIKQDPAPFSKTYYYQFFRRYAEGLVIACDLIAASLNRGGIATIFVRDTVRKDVLFPTGKLVDWALCDRNGFEKVRHESLVVRSHVGYRRKNQVKGLFGLAQREHWLSYRASQI